ncbi:MAG: hypothetical protein QME40_03810 [bacterium]|nr:hypothetical protein [bacterium]
MRYLWLMIIPLILMINPCLSLEEPVFISGIRPLGIGGAFVAIADDQNALFYNPAGLTQIGGIITPFDLSFEVNQDSLDLLNFFMDNEEKLRDLEGLSNEDREALLKKIIDKVIRLRSAGTISGPIPINYIRRISERHSVGFGIPFTKLSYSIRVKDAGFAIARINLKAYGDIIFPIAYAYRSPLPKGLSLSIPLTNMKIPISEDISFGVSLKGIIRWLLELNDTLLTISEFDKLAVLEGRGIALDIGLLYKVNQRTSIGLVSQDLFGTRFSWNDIETGSIIEKKEDTVVYPTMRLGISYRPAWLQRYSNIRDILFAFDVTNIFDGRTTFFNQLHFGGEIRVLRFILARFGFNQGYPSYGLGIDFPILKLDYVYYGRELGMYPGQIPEWNHMIGLAIRF